MLAKLCMTDKYTETENLTKPDGSPDVGQDGKQKTIDIKISRAA